MAQNDNKHTFVSRGGIKLQAALDSFKVDVNGKTCLDVGSSTGGFVDCLLQNGAKKVYALDTSYGELAWKLRVDPRVVVMERTNILHLVALPLVIPAKAGIQNNRWIPDQVGDDNIKMDLITIDAGWTKLELVLNAVRKFLKPKGQLIALLKPHYEAEKSQLKKGILSPQLAEQIKNEVSQKILNSKFIILNSIPSPILGGGGNTEYLLQIVLS